MRIVTMRPLREFWAKHAQAKSPLLRFAETVRAVDWRNFNELRATLPYSDRLNNCVIFDIGGNNYRLIAWIHYSRQLKSGRWSKGRIYVRKVLSHAEYDKGDWKADCA